jgi:hypothetical protein
MVIGYLLFDALILAGINDKSPITNRQFFVLPLRLDPLQKALVIGEW